jgi:sugar lactone lactonase YvrE
MKRFIKFTLALVLGLVLLLVTIAYVRYGGGKPYPSDISGPGLLEGAALETVIAYPEPIGNVAASNDTAQAQRVFFTVHPESHPEYLKLLEIIEGKAVPYPSEAFQAKLITPLGVFCDHQNRLWVIDHGNHGFDPVKLIAFDLNSNQVAHEYIFPTEVAEKGSFFNDLSVSPDGKTVVVADVSFWRKKPSLIVYDVEQKRSRSLLDGHESVSNQGWLPVNNIKKMRFFGGLADLMPGIDGLDVDPTGKWVYFAAMSHDQAYRISLEKVRNFDLSAEEIAKSVESIGKKPLSDGVRADSAQNLLITDVDHNGIYLLNGDTKKGQTLIKDQRIRWADGLSLGGDGYWYLADSAIPHQMLQSKKHMAENKPYYIFRFRMPNR